MEATPQTETTGDDFVGDPSFSEFVPVTPGGGQIVVKDDGGTALGAPLLLAGTAPTVGITTPDAGFVGTGAKTVTWTITDPDSTSFTSRVLYSPDNGTHWSVIGAIPDDTSFGVDFDALPGTVGATALVRVLVSDGAHTGSATSAAFTVAKKSPASALIAAPEAGFAQAAADPIVLVGYAHDPDDGMLTGAQLQWSSNLQGALGSGSPLSTKLQPGTHTITFTATDSDEHAVTATTNVLIGGDPPALRLTTSPANGGCTNVTVTAAPGANGGAPLTSVQFTVDGGTSYVTIPDSEQPFSFVAPGNGGVTVTARAYDASQQSSARSVDVVNPSGCPAHGPVCVGGTTISKAKLSVAKIGTPLGNETLSVKAHSTSPPAILRSSIRRPPARRSSWRISAAETSSGSTSRISRWRFLPVSSARAATRRTGGKSSPTRTSRGR